jgi:penicillin-binding protein 1B
MTGNQPAFKNNPKVFRKKSLWRRIVTPRRVFFLSLLVLPVIGVLVYYYVVFAAMIDQKLRGDVFVRSSGIYAAPVRLVNGSPFGKTEIINYLNRIGYLPKDKTTDAKRGKYLLAGNTLEIIPGPDASTTARTFPHVKIRFNGERPVGFNDLDTKKDLPECYLEPPLLTALNKDKEKRKNIEYKDIPKELVGAVTSIEDRRFFEHPGIDFRGLARAIYVNFTDPDGTKQGASTITQQLVKNFFLTPERTFERKLKEAYISIILETRLSKQEIFQMYCNEIYLGQDGNYSINGMGEAATFYFGKDVINLKLEECAFLAGIIRGPGYYSPYSHLERATERRNKVLGDMLEVGAITQAQHDAAVKTKVEVKSKRASSNADAPYFLDYLQQKLAEMGSEKVLADQSLRIYTSIDLQLQQAADKAVRDGLAALEKAIRRPKPGLQAALVAINPKTGEVLAMTGGRDYSSSQLNRATDAHRQPGSVFKPIVYTTAIEDGSVTPSTLFQDAKRSFVFGRNEQYTPDNFGESYSNRKVTVRTALTKSLNVVTVQVAEAATYAKVARMAERFGLPKPEPYPSLALGVKEATPLEVARAYTTFPNGGKRVDPMPFTMLTDSKGKVIQTIAPQETQVISADVACVMTHLLQGPVERGTAAAARGLNKALAGKTGTSRDGWFAGFTPNLVCVVYVGYDDNSQLGITGGNSALPIFARFMKQALALRPDLGGATFPETNGIDKVKVDLQTGLLPTKGEDGSEKACSGETIEEFFLKGTAPSDDCTHVNAEELLDPTQVPLDPTIPINQPKPDIAPLEVPPDEPDSGKKPTNPKDALKKKPPIPD